ncbi:short-chain dehydrogenase [Thioclava sp. SK-1]|uniref:SDR family NAD(P)-dependent oxidoreductase n=1 Tax=Thioclava sp. SK-1 TaxID=1889770 RepID=UPI0008243165|nr:SDR family NAD(P)-dependent oxidoreductase [Thioclava sp. SK-1]OCX66480.1 short-chain dehydrogenase [Thioclava sp. SK-1]
MHKPRETIWIIGASSGIGAALARHYAQTGAELIISARSEDKLSKIAKEIGALPLPVDVADRDSLRTAIDQISKPLDRIIHLAALYDPGRIAYLDPDRAAQLVQVNLMGAFHVAQLCPPALREGGQLAICGSVAGYVGLPKGQMYSATKAGVMSLVESLRSETDDRDIRLISPGFVDTPLTAKNDFDMPFVIPPEQAAKAIVKGLNGRAYEVHFPIRFTLMLKLLQALPYWLRLPILRKMVA